MHRKFITFVVTVSIVIAGFGAAPARADNNDLARALAAIVGIAVIGAAIKNKRDKDKVSRNYHQPVQPRYVEPRYAQPRYAPPRHAHPQQRYYPDPVRPRPLPSRVNRKLLPGDCLRSFETRQGTMRLFAEQCLLQNYRYVDQLPSHCAVKVRTRGGHRWGYDARCLRNQGYQLARR